MFNDSLIRQLFTYTYCKYVPACYFMGFLIIFVTDGVKSRWLVMIQVHFY